MEITLGPRPIHLSVRAAVVLGLILAITLMYREVPDERVLLNKVLQYLYFLPIVLSAFWFGWQGGVLAALVTSIFYIPAIPFLGGSADTSRAEEYGEALDLLITGSVVGILANRERRRALELEQANSQLEATYRQLAESVQRLRQSERLSAVGQLAANLAHEIRNPLASIEGAADLLKGGTEAHEFVEIIKKESRRLSHLLTELLDFARPRSPQRVSVSLAEIARGVGDLVLPVAKKAGVEIRYEFLEPPQPVTCDPSQIKQVILNLVINAVQAGGDVVTLRESREDGFAVVEVCDEGEGLTSEQHQQIFIPFYTTKKDGSGLGLSIAQQLAHAHGGDLVAEANTPRGSIFRLRLPVKAQV